MIVTLSLKPEVQRKKNPIKTTQKFHKLTCLSTRVNLERKKITESKLRLTKIIWLLKKLRKDRR